MGQVQFHYSNGALQQWWVQFYYSNGGFNSITAMVGSILLQQWWVQFYYSNGGFNSITTMVGSILLQHSRPGPPPNVFDSRELLEDLNRLEEGIPEKANEKARVLGQVGKSLPSTALTVNFFFPCLYTHEWFL